MPASVPMGQARRGRLQTAFSRGAGGVVGMLACALLSCSGEPFVIADASSADADRGAGDLGVPDFDACQTPWLYFVASDADGIRLERFTLHEDRVERCDPIPIGGLDAFTEAPIAALMLSESEAIVASSIQIQRYDFDAEVAVRWNAPVAVGAPGPASSVELFPIDGIRVGYGQRSVGSAELSALAVFDAERGTPEAEPSVDGWRAVAGERQPEGVVWAATDARVVAVEFATGLVEGAPIERAAERLGVVRNRLALSAAGRFFLFERAGVDDDWRMSADEGIVPGTCNVLRALPHPLDPSSVLVACAASASRVERVGVYSVLSGAFEAIAEMPSAEVRDIAVYDP